MKKQLLSYIQTTAIGILMLLGLTFTSIGMTISPVGAAPQSVIKTCPPNSQTEVCKGTDDKTLTNLIKNIINLLLYVIGIIAVIMIIIGAIRYTTSGGDGGETKTARDTIIYAVAGLVIAIMSFAIVNLVLANI